MRIIITMTPNTTITTRTIDLEELDITEEDWNVMSNDEREDILNDWCGDHSDQPYWMVSTFKTKE